MSTAHFHLSTVLQLMVFQDLSHERCRSEPQIRLAYLPNFNCSVLAYYPELLIYVILLKTTFFFFWHFFPWFRKIFAYALHLYQTMYPFNPECRDAGRQVARATKFCTFGRNSGSLVW